MHIILKNGMPELVDAPLGVTLLSCRIEFPMHPVRKQIMGPAEAVIRFSTASGEEDKSTIPVKVSP